MHFKHFAALALAAAMTSGAAYRLSAGEPGVQAGVVHTSLKAGDTAPDFSLLDNKWKPVRLSDFRGKKNVILAFYILAFTEG